MARLSLTLGIGNSASMTPAKIEGWRQFVFAVRDLVLAVVGGVWFLSRLGYGPEFFILLMKFLKPSI